MKRGWIFFLCLFSVLPSGWSEDVQVNSSFDKRSAQVGEEIHLNIQIRGAQGNIQAPRLPAFKGFDTFYTGRSSHITFINGQSSSSVEFSYVLVPRTKGHFNLAPIEVFVGSRKFTTEPIEIDVYESPNRFAGTSAPPSAPTYHPPPDPFAALPVPSQEPPPSFQPDDDNIFVRAWTDKTTAYPNEQILLTYSLYTRYDTRYEGFQKEPQVSGFWIEEFPMERDVRRETVRFNDKRYVKADVKKMALFPTTAADYTIDPGSLKVTVRQEPETTSIFDEFFNDSFFSGGGFFSRREERLLQPPPIQLKVIPFPEKGKPSSFQGAVGNFRLSATLDKNAVKQNEPVTLKLVIEGEGNIETLNKPKIPEVPKFKIYDADTSSQLFKTGNVIGGQKTFEVVFIPIEAGSLKIPSLEFSFFNPVAVSYQVLKTPEFPIQVAPSEQPFKLPKNLSEQEVFKKEIQLEGKDIRYIRERLTDEGAEVFLDFGIKGLIVLNTLLAVLVILGLLRQQQEKIYTKDHALRRRRFARPHAESRIRRLRSWLRQDKDISLYFQEVEKILTRYLADKFNWSTHGITRLEIEHKLREIFGPDVPLFGDVLELYKLSDESRFGKGSVPADAKNEALKILREVISRVERAGK